MAGGNPGETVALWLITGLDFTPFDSTGTAADYNIVNNGVPGTSYPVYAQLVTNPQGPLNGPVSNTVTVTVT